MKEYYYSTNEEEDLKTLESIPPLYLKLLIQIEPVVRYVSHFVDILVWKSTSRSFIVLFIWITLCQWTKAWMILGLPVFALVQHLADWFNLKILYKRRKSKEQHIRVEKDLDVSTGQQYPAIQKIQLRETLDHLQKIQTFWTHSYWKSMLVEVKQLPMYLYVYAWIMWSLLHFCFTLNTIVCFIGIWLLVSCSPSYRFIAYSLKNNAYAYHVARAVTDYHIAFFCYYYHALFILKDEKSKIQYNDMTPPPSPTLSHQNEPKPCEIYRCEIPVIIEIFENERWWLGLNWTKDLLSAERRPWTDNQYKPIISKEDYKLPNDKVINTSFEDKFRMKSTIRTWVWSDRDWWIDMTGELDDKVDPNGWKYTDNKWQNPMNIPGPHSFTRQRKWCKRAKLIEKQMLYE